MSLSVALVAVDQERWIIGNVHEELVENSSGTLFRFSLPKKAPSMRCR